MSTCKITYNGNEISAVDETAPVSVAYNSATISTLNDGDTKTLGCHGKVMASDVVIGSKTLNCNGKLMQGDIVVELVGSTPSGETWYFNDTIGMTASGRIVVNFTSNGIAYNAMTRTRVGTTVDQLRYVFDDGVNASYNHRVYNYRTSKWYKEYYRTIVLDEPATGDVLAFLEANATKLS